MYPRNCFIRMLGGLILLAILFVGGYFVFQAGVVQGAAGQLPAEAVAPMTPYHPYFGFIPFFGLGIFFKIALLAFAFFFVMRLFMFGAWAAFGGPSYRRHWRQHRSWWDEDESDNEESGPKDTKPKTEKN